MITSVPAARAATVASVFGVGQQDSVAA